MEYTEVYAIAVSTVKVLITAPLQYKCHFDKMFGL